MRPSHPPISPYLATVPLAILISFRQSYNLQETGYPSHNLARCLNRVRRHQRRRVAGGPGLFGWKRVQVLRRRRTQQVLKLKEKWQLKMLQLRP